MRLALVCKLPLILNDSRRLCQANQYPLAALRQHQAPRPIEFSPLLSALLVAQAGPHFGQLSLLPAGSVSTSRFLNFDLSLTTLFSLTQAGVVRLLARYAATPVSL